MAAKTKSPAGRKLKLTKKLIGEICDLIEQGAYDYIAAGACGISRTTYYRWIQEGGSDDAPALKREFRDEVALARAKCRSKMEIEVAKADPKFWLRNGPGKTRKNEPGWTDPIGEAPVDGETGETLPVTSDAVIMDKLLGLRSRVLAQREAEAAAEAAAEDGPPSPKKAATRKAKKKTAKRAKRPTPRPKPKK